MKHIKGEISHIKGNFLPEDSLEYLNRLRADVPWERMKWGRGYLPRLIFRCDGDQTGGASHAWPEPIKELRDRTEETFQCTVRAGWCNLYQSGGDYTPPHQDQYNAHVITWSFGGTRRFITEEIETRKKKEYLLEDGDVFYFSPRFDQLHKHSIPKTAKIVDPRVSIVFFTDQPYCGSHWHNQIDRPFGGLDDVADGLTADFNIVVDEEGKIIGLETEDGTPIFGNLSYLLAEILLSGKTI